MTAARDLRTSLPTSLEFHDSTLLDLNRNGTSVQLRLDAYVHQWDVIDGEWQGSGWLRPVQITVADGVIPTIPSLPAELDGGGLDVGSTVYGNLVPVPLLVSRCAVLRLELVSGETLEITGSGLSVQATGAGAFVEVLPVEWAPVPE